MLRVGNHKKKKIKQPWETSGSKYSPGMSIYMMYSLELEIMFERNL